MNVDRSCPSHLLPVRVPHDNRADDIGSIRATVLHLLREVIIKPRNIGSHE
jgi:hypothetical protein